MAKIKIGMMLADDTNSINKRTNSAKALNKELEKTQNLSKTALGGGVASQEVTGYGRQRAVIGTGAAGRDFANQAEGLGGIVRLYATFAANIFAVGAAFQALNRSAQMERIIQASELMSQRVGVNLKGLGRDLQEATGYALSFEQSMQFANIGTSAGIAGKDLQELVTIAKGAAAGLGRDVTDSITRIIQGTAKQEQEILDELGIFIKAKDAYEEYARKFQIEGGADALSAQQRVRAYSDAVIKAGQQWKEFANIPDPFSQLTARGSEAVNQILKSVNQIVVPVLELLAKSGDAIKALLLLIAGTLVKRALPELASGLTKVFTFDSTRAKAEATKARQAIVSEYNIVTTELKAAKSVRDKLLMETPGGVVSALGGIAGIRPTKTDPGNVGISAQRLTTAIFGTASKPVDLTKYKDVEDVNKKILSTLNQQVKAKKEQADILVNDLIKNKVIEASSTKDNLILSQQTRAVGQSIYTDLVTKRIKAQTDVVNLTQREVDLTKQMQSFQQGTTAAVIARQKATTAGATAAGVANVAGPATAAAAAVSLREAFGSGLGQIGDRSRQLATQLDKGTIASLKAFGSALFDNLKSIKTAGDGLTGMARAAASAGAAVGTLGTIVSGAFRLIGAAFGPLLIMFSLWEMFGDKIVPQSITRMKELESRTSDLRKELSNVSQAVDYAAAAYTNSNKSIGAYLTYIETVNNSLNNQIDILDKLIALEREKARIARGEKPKTEEELRREDTERVLKRASEAGVDVTNAKRQLEELNKRLDSLNSQEQRVREVTQNLASDYAQALASVTDVFLGLQVNREGVLTALKGAQITSPSDYVTKLRKGEIGDFKLSVQDRAAADQLSTALRTAVESSAAAALGGINEGFLADRLRAARATRGESEARRREASAQVYEIEKKLREEIKQQTEKAASEAAKLAAAFKNSENSIDEIGKKIKNLPTFSNIAKTPEGIPIEKAFNEVFESLKKYEGRDIISILPDKNKLEATKNSLISQLESLSSAGIKSAEPLAEKIKDTGFADLSTALNTYRTDFNTVLEDINEATSNYTKSTREQFLRSSQTIDKQKQSIQKAALAQSSLNEKMSAFQSILGQIPQRLINDELDQQKKLNLDNYNLSLSQAKLELDRVNLNRTATQEDKNSAKQIYDAAVAQANIAKQILDAEAERVKRAKELASELNKISKKYEEIAIKQGIFRAEEQARISLVETQESLRRQAVSPIQAVSIEDRQRQRQLQRQSNVDIENLTRERDRQLEELRAKSQNLQDPAIEAEVDRINNLFKDQVNSISAILALNQERLKIEKSIAESAARTQMAQEAVSKKYEQKSSEEGMALKTVDLEKQRLQILYEQGRLSGDQLDSATRDLELIQRQIDYRGRLNEINERYETKRVELEEKLQASGDSEYLAQQVAENERLRARDTKNLQDTYNAQQVIYDSMENFTRRQKAWGDSIEKVFTGIGDAMIDWAKTGKRNSRELINQLVEDIARYEMRLMMHDRWMQVRKPIMDFLGSAFGNFGGWFSKNVFGPQSIDLSASYANPGMRTTIAPMAKGMSYMSGGVEYFAKGGTFSNSIVNSPTLFKAAKGLGVMGEAGPEAIMPLKRDSNGVLGVRGGSSNNVEVVVNNYSSEKATTKETTDSRGNKRIEVIVGEAVATQIVKTGSAVQRSMGGAYGLTPQLIRR